MGILIVLTQNLQYFRFLQYLLLFVNLRNEIDLFLTQTYITHWKSQYSKRYIVILTKFPLAAREITLLTTSGTTSDKNFVKMTQDFRFREGKYSDNIYYVKKQSIVSHKERCITVKVAPGNIQGSLDRYAFTWFCPQIFATQWNTHIYSKFTAGFCQFCLCPRTLVVRRESINNEQN